MPMGIGAIGDYDVGMLISLRVKTDFLRTQDIGESKSIANSLLHRGAILLELYPKEEAWCWCPKVSFRLRGSRAIASDQDIRIIHHISSKSTDPLPQVR